MNWLLSLRYYIVAACCLILHNVSVVAADAYGLNTVEAITVSFMLVVVVGYCLHSIYTFRTPLFSMRFLDYAFAMTMNVPLAFGGTWLLHDALGLAMVIASPITSVAMTLINYLTSRWAFQPTAVARKYS